MRVRWLARLLFPRLKRISEARPPDFEITKDGGPVYLRRWWIVPRNQFFNVYLHNMLRDDDAVLHDHPYVSVSLVLTDGLLERYSKRPRTVLGFTKNQNTGNYDVPTSISMLDVQERFPRQGDLVWRSSRLAHQLIVESEAWTLFVTGPRVREWGFWCPRGWRPWSQYVAASQNSAGAGSGTSGVGLGCGEE